MGLVIRSYGFPTEIHLGPGARSLLSEKLEALGLKRPLIVADTLVAGLPFFKEIASLAAGSAVWSGVSGNPVASQVAAGAAAFKAHRADGIVAVGGGAAIDVAKAIAVAGTRPGDLFDYALGAKPQRAIEGELPPIVAVPTAAGTGCEVGRSSVISHDDTKRKRILFSAKLLPRVVLADPELTFGVPPKVTAATGMDAITHLAEAYLSKGSVNPMCDAIALAGLRIAARCLPIAVKKPHDLEARTGLMDAAIMGATAFQKGLGAVHSFAHALSTVADLHHGLANGIMIPYVLEFNRPAVRSRMKDLAAAVGAKDFIAWLKALRKKIGIPHTLRPAGITSEHLDRLVEVAAADFCHGENPRPVSKMDFRRIYTTALGK